jgi:arylsulfatase A-like enzyme/cytochrome c-type biogenesis protein CcmH/NrfG
MKPAVFLLLLSMTAATCARRHGIALTAGALGGASVVLVTIDTLRADRVGAYGNSAGLTPTIDRLANEGIRFARTYAHAPLTLPSHASLLTGRYPTHTGVHDNGTFQLGEMATLATTLKAAGYRTAAFVGAFVLDARFGLHRGFDTYDDRMIGSSADLDVVQRTADQVLAPALQWIVSARAQPGRFFAWVHLYDPHEPYAAPEPYRSRYGADPYGGEIAYADRALGEFFDRLGADNRLTDTLVVVASDHGESLGEHGERTHGLFAYDATLRVPLIIWAPPRLPPSVVSGTSRLVDVAPTILDLVGAAPLEGVDGRSLRPLINGDGDGDSESYFEALNANLTRNWAPLRGLVGGGLKIIDLPQPELYDLASDPGEQRNLYGRQRERARPLEERLDHIVNAASAVVMRPSIDPDAEARLRALGYVVSTAAKPSRTYTAADDPKQLVHLNGALDDAAAMWARGEAENAIATLRMAILDRPDLTVAYDRLAFILRARGRASEAVQLLDAAARQGLSDRGLLRALGSALREAGEIRRSADVLEALVRDDGSDLQAADALGQTYARLGRPADAEALFKRVLARSPNASTTWNNLGSLYLSQQRSSDAMHALTQAVAINPALATAHNGLGVAYARAGQMDRAVAEWRKALELRPNFGDARHNLERAIRK